MTYYYDCENESDNVEMLYKRGFSLESAIEIAAWAYIKPEGSEYDQNEVPGVKIYIVDIPD